MHKDLFLMIIQKTVEDPDPWKSLKRAGRLALVCKRFNEIVSEKVRAEIILRLLPGLDEGEKLGTKPESSEFGQEISKCVAIANEWMKSKRVVYSIQSPVRIRWSQNRAGELDDLWALLSSSAGLFGGMLTFGLREERRIHSHSVGSTGSVFFRVFAFAAGGAAAGYGLWRIGAWTHRGMDVNLDFFPAWETRVEFDDYPEKGFKPRTQTLQSLMDLNVPRLVRSCAFERQQDAVVCQVLVFCAQRVKDRAETEEEGKSAVKACSQIWSSYCS